jgi:hypothetical protein
MQWEVRRNRPAEGPQGAARRCKGVRWDPRPPLELVAPAGHRAELDERPLKLPCGGA